MSEFSGFPRETITFLKNLKKNNSKKWLDAHRDEYEDHLIEPARHFVVAMGKKLKTAYPKITADPRVNGSIRRMARDIRFSKDKTPYKTYLDVMFREGDERLCQSPVLVLRLQSDTVTVGTGIHEFAKETLANYRAAVVDSSKGPALRRAAGKMEKAGYAIHGQHYKRVPRGFDPEHANARYLLHRGLYAGLDTALPDSIHSPKFVTYCMDHYRKLAPLYDWLSAI